MDEAVLQAKDVLDVLADHGQIVGNEQDGGADALGD